MESRFIRLAHVLGRTCQDRTKHKVWWEENTRKVNREKVNEAQNICSSPKQSIYRHWQGMFGISQADFENKKTGLVI